MDNPHLADEIAALKLRVTELEKCSQSTASCFVNTTKSLMELWDTLLKVQETLQASILLVAERNSR